MKDEKIKSAVGLMIDTKHMHKNLFESELRATGLYGTQHRILMHLACCKKLNSQKSLADHLQITPAAVTGALKKLESDGYISRSPGVDNRFYELEITDKGRDAVEMSKCIFSSIDRSLFDGFTDDELDAYICCLEKIKNNIKIYSSTRKEDK